MAAQEPARGGQGAAGPNPIRQPVRWRDWLFSAPAAILAIGLLATGAATWMTHASAATRERARLAEMADGVAERVAERRQAVMLLTRALSGALALDAEVTPEEFRRHASGLSLGEGDGAIAAMGFAARTPRERREATVERVRGDDGPESESYPVALIEPETDLNRRLLGLDVGAQPATAPALEQAATLGGPAMSARIDFLPGRTEQERVGFMVLSPAYRSMGGGQVELSGFVFAACRAGELLGDLARDGPGQGYWLTVYDGTEPAASSALYEEPRRRDGGGLVERRMVERAGPPWTLELESTPALARRSAAAMAPLVALAGVGLTGTALMASLVGARTGARFRVLRRRAQRAQEALNQVSRSGLVGVAVFDPSWRVVEANQAFVDLFGYSQEDIATGQVTLGALRAPTAEEQGRAGASHEGHNYVGPYEQLFRRKDGSEVWILAGCGALSRGEGRIGFAVDITAQKQAEEEVRRLNASLEDQVRARTAELADLAEQLDAFARNVSHDLRAPLRAIEEYAGILLEQPAEEVGEEGRRLAERIAAAARRMDRLIVELLAYSRLARSELPLEAVDVGEVVREALAASGEGLRRSGAEVRAAPDLPVVRAHRPVLLQALVNLLDNAVKFTRPGERPRITVRAEEREGMARVIVEDEGIGLPPGAEERARIFRVFARLHSSDAYEGTGIGLAIVKKGVERMGGRAGVEDNQPRGARFWIELPPARRVAPEAPEGESCRIG